MNCTAPCQDGLQLRNRQDNRNRNLPQDNHAHTMLFPLRTNCHQLPTGYRLALLCKRYTARYTRHHRKDKRDK